MRSVRPYGPLIANAAIVLAGIVGMVAIVRSTSVEPDKSRQADAARTEASRLGRLSFARPGTLSMDQSRPEQSEWLVETAPAHETNWSTEARTELETEPPPPLRPSNFGFRFPWSSPSPAPATRPKSYTLKARLAELTPPATARLAARFEAAQASWPPAEIVLIAIKDERALELHARPAGGAWKLVHRYKVLAASGGRGPKLRQGDKQVPEGIYGISFLNPNSAYHVSMRVNYPNTFDRQMAAKDGRRELGGDIMIHGKNLSAGCLAMGDEAVEELFVLAAQVGLKQVKLIIAPTDLRHNGVPQSIAGHPEWVPKLYAEIAMAMADYRAPKQESKSLLSLFTW